MKATYRQVYHKLWNDLGVVFSIVMICILSLQTSSALAQEVTLNLLHCWGPPRDEWVNDSIKSFEARYPHIKVNPIISGCGSAISERLITSIASGTTFDVAMAWTDTMRSLAAQEALISIDDYMEKEGLKDEIWFPAEIDSGKWKGTTYGLPITTGGDASNLLFYNLRLFDEAGLDSSNPPETFEDMFEVSHNLIRFDGDKVVQIPFDFNGEGTYNPLSWVYAGGGEFISEDGSELVFASEEVKSTVRFLRNYVTNHFRDASLIPTGGIQAFINGEVAMLTRGSSHWGSLKGRDPDLPLGVGLHPKLPESQWTGAHPGTWSFVIPQGTRYPDEAWLLLHWLTVPEESAGYFLLRQGRASPIISHNSNPLYFDENPFFEIIPRAIESAATLPIQPGFDQIYNEFRTTWRQIIRNHNVEPDGLLDDLQRRMNVLLKEYNSILESL